MPSAAGPSARTTRSQRAPAAAGRAVSPDEPASPVSVVVGEEELLVERAVAVLVSAAGPADTIQHVKAADLHPGELTTLTAPSLFGDRCVVVVHGAEVAAKNVADEITALAADPPPDTTAVLTHAGGAKGRALLTALVRSQQAAPGGDAPGAGGRVPEDHPGR